MGVFDVPKYIHGAAFEKGVSIELLMSVVYLLLILFYVSRLIYYLKYVDADIFVVTGISRFVCFKYRGAVYTVSHAWKPLIFRTDSFHFSWDFKNYGLDLSCTSKPQFSDLRSGIVVVCKMVIDGVIVPKRAEVCIVTFRGRNYYAAAFGNYPGSSGSPVYQDLNLVGVYGYNVLQNDGLWYSILQPVLEEDDHPIAYDINGIGLFYGSTGSGKTSQMIRLIRAGTGKKFLVVSPTVFLMEQMIDRMKESGINPSFQNYKGSTIADGIQYGNPNVIVTTAYGLDIGKYIGYRIFIDEFDYPSAEYFNMMRKVKGMNYIAMSATTHKHNRIVEDSTVPFRRIGVSQVFGLLNNCKKLGKSVLIIHHVPSHIQNIIDTFNMEVITSRNSGDFRKYPLWSSGSGDKHKVLDRHGAFVVTTPIARRGIAVNFEVIIDYGKEVVLHVDKYITRKIVSCSYATIQQSYGRLAGRRPGEFYLIDTQLELQLRCTDELLLAYYESLDGIYRFPTYDFSLLGRLKDPLPVTDPQSVLLLTLHNSRQADAELAKLGFSVEPKATRDEPIMVEPVMMYTGKVKMTEAVYGYPLYNSALEWLCFILFEFVFRFTFGHVRVAKCSRIMIWHYMIDVLVLVGSILLDIYHSHLKLFGLGYALGVFITTAFTYSRVALVMRERSVEKLKTHRAGDILVNDIFVYGLDPVIVTFMVSFNPIIIGINMVFAYMLSMYYADLSDLGSRYYRHMALNIREMKQYLSPDERTRRMDEFSALYYKETLEPRALFITVFGHKYGSGMEEDIENSVKDPHFPSSKPNFRIYSILMIIANGIMGSKGSVLLYGYVLITTFPVLFKYSDTIVNNLPTTVRVWYHRYPAEWLLVAAPVIGHIYHYSEFYKFFALHE